MHKGFVLLHRKLRETSFYKNSQAVHLAVHLLLEANHQTRKIYFNNAEITIERGQVLTGRLALSKETGIKPSSVRNLLLLLKVVGFLDIKSNNKFSIITIRQYEHYQNVSLWVGQQEGQPEDNQRTTKGQQKDTPKECNNDNNNIKITQHFKKNVAPESPEFEKAWTLYPARNGKKLLKAEAKASFLKIKETDVPLVLIAIQNYASSQGAQDGFAKDMVRFLRNDRWREWLTMEIVQEITKKEPYPGGASIPWRSEQSPHPKPADPELVKQTLSEIKKNLYHEKQSIQKILPNNHKSTFIAPTQNELLLAEKKKIDNRKRLIQLYRNDPS